MSIKFRSLKTPVQHVAEDGTIYWKIKDLRQPKELSREELVERIASHKQELKDVNKIMKHIKNELKKFDSQKG